MPYLRYAALILTFSGILLGSTVTGLSRAAEYYYSRQDYRQAMQLLAEVLKKQPDETSSLVRLAELKSMIEGKRSGQAVLLSALQSRGLLMDGYSRTFLQRKLSQILSTFMSDEAQSLFLQAKPKLNFNDCDGALVLLNQSLAVESENLQALKEKARCEKKINAKEANLATIRAMYALNPYDSTIINDFITALFGTGNYAEIISVLGSTGDDSPIEENKLVYAASLVETKSDAEALVILETLSRNMANHQSPITLHLRSRVFSRYQSMRKDEIKDLQSILFFAKNPPKFRLDPAFDLEKIIKDAKRRLEEIGSANPIAG